MRRKKIKRMSSNCGGYLVFNPELLSIELKAYGAVYRCACECHIEGYHDIFNKTVGYYQEEGEKGNDCIQSFMAHCVEACFCCNDSGWLDENQDKIDFLKEPKFLEW